MKEMDEEQRKEDEKERIAQELIEKREAEKLKKQEERQVNHEQATAEKLALKAQRREEYLISFSFLFCSRVVSCGGVVVVGLLWWGCCGGVVVVGLLWWGCCGGVVVFLSVIFIDMRRYERNTALEKIRRKKEWEERQAKLLAEFLERQKRRELKAKKGALPKPEPIDYDDRKVSLSPLNTKS
jgi:hypothetical protein